MFNSVDLDLLAKEIAKNNAVLFVGAGFSKNAVPKNEHVTTKFMDWYEFILMLGRMVWPEISDDSKLRERCTDFLYVVQLFKDRYGEDEFYKMVKLAIPTNDYVPTNIHKDLLIIPWTDVVTTNMDDLVEKTFDSLNLPHDLLVDDEQISINSNPYPKIIKMHGTVERPNTIVFSEEDYRLYEERHPLMVVKIKQIFAEKTVFFIGFSLTDPNFKKIFLWVNDILKKYQKKAYAFIPNSDRNEIEYWRDRNIVIFSNNDREVEYSKKINIFIKELSDCISKYSFKNYNSVRLHIFGDIDYSKLCSELLQDLEYYTKNNREEDAFRIIELIIDSIYTYLKKAEQFGVYHKFRTDILNDLLLCSGRVTSNSYGLPDIIFEKFNTINLCKDAKYKLVEILEKYIEAFQKTKIVIERTLESNNSMGQFNFPKEYDLFDMLINSKLIKDKTKQFIIYSKIKELYYNERKYDETITFIQENKIYLENLYFQDEVRYIELLCNKHNCDFDNILYFLREDSFKQENSLNNLRLGYLYYLTNDIVNMRKNYEKALNNSEKSVVNSLTAIYNLKLFSMSSYYSGDTTYKEFLQNKEEQIKYRMSFNREEKELFNVKDELIKLEVDIVQCLVKDSGKQTNYTNVINPFKEFVKLAEYNGVPDIFISKNSYFEILFNYLKQELSTKSYLESFFSFGVNVKNVEFKDKVIEYSKVREYLFDILGKKLKNNIRFLKTVGVDTNFVGFSFPVRVLDETIKYLIDVISVFDEQWLLTIADNMFEAINLNLQQFNNTIKENAVKLTIKIINILSPEESIKLFERYLQCIINRNLDWLMKIDGIQFLGWKCQTFSKFNYSFLIDIMSKLETVSVHNIAQYFALIININAICEIPSKYKEELLRIALRLETHKMHRTYLLLLKSVGFEKEKLKAILDNIYENYVKVTDEDLSNKEVFSMSTGENYYLFGDCIEYLEKVKQEKIIELGIQQILKIENRDPFLFGNDYLKEAVQYFLFKYSIKNNEFIELKKYIEKYTVYISFEIMEQFRQVFEKQPILVKPILDVFFNKIRTNDKNIKLNTLINLKKFYRFSTKIITEEYDIIEKIKCHLYEVDLEVLAWTIDVLGTIIKQNREWAKDNSNVIADILLINSDTLIIDSEKFLISLAYLLTNIVGYCDENRREGIERLINSLKNINSRRINNELICKE